MYHNHINKYPQISIKTGYESIFGGRGGRDKRDTEKGNICYLPPPLPNLHFTYIRVGTMIGVRPHAPSFKLV